MCQKKLFSVSILSLFLVFTSCSVKTDKECNTLINQQVLGKIIPKNSSEVVSSPFGIQAGGSLRVFSGSRYTPILSSAYPPLSELPDGFNGVYTEERGSSSLPAFWLLNLGLEKSLKVNDNVTASLLLDWYNVTNNSIAIELNPNINAPADGFKETLKVTNPGIFQYS